MEDERRQQDGGDGASVSVGEASDVTLARKESSAMMAMLQALMTEIIVKIDQHTEKIDQQTEKIDQRAEKIDQLTEKIDQRAAQIRNLAARNAQARDEVVAVQEPPELERQLCGVTGHCMTLPGPVMSTIAVGGVVEKLTVSVDDMEKPCLLGLDSLFGNAVCDDLGRIQRQVCGEVIPLIL